MTIPFVDNATGNHGENSPAIHRWGWMREENKVPHGTEGPVLSSSAGLCPPRASTPAMNRWAIVEGAWSTNRIGMESSRRTAQCFPGILSPAPEPFRETPVLPPLYAGTRPEPMRRGPCCELANVGNIRLYHLSELNGQLDVTAEFRGFHGWKNRPLKTIRAIRAIRAIREICGELLPHPSAQLFADPQSVRVSLENGITCGYTSHMGFGTRRGDFFLGGK